QTCVRQTSRKPSCSSWRSSNMHDDFLRVYLPTNRQKCAINVGAHDGLWVGQFKDLFSQVIAIEASPAFANRLRQRYPAPPTSNVEIIEVAGWIQSGQTLDLHVRKSMPMSFALACRDLVREDSVS